jgi:predicted dehydrogenase
LEAAQALTGQLDCPAYPDHLALDASTVDAAIVCSPPDSHPAVVTDLLEAGIHVMCEKPLAVDVESARSIVKAAEAAGTIVTMASKFRYVDDVTRAKAIVDSGILGEMILFENNFTARVDMSERWNSKRAVSGGGVLIDNGTHSVDIARYFLGAIADVFAIEGKRVQTLEVEDTAQMFLRTIGGVRATIDLSWSIDKERDSYIDIYGSEGTVRVGWGESRYRQSSSPSWVTFGSGYDKIAAMRAQIENLCGAIRGDEHLVITSDDAIASVEVIAAAYESMNRCNWVGAGTVAQSSLA